MFARDLLHSNKPITNICIPQCAISSFNKQTDILIIFGYIVSRFILFFLFSFFLLFSLLQRILWERKSMLFFFNNKINVVQHTINIQTLSRFLVSICILDCFFFLLLLLCFKFLFRNFLFSEYYLSVINVYRSKIKHFYIFT